MYSNVHEHNYRKMKNLTLIFVFLSAYCVQLSAQNFDKAVLKAAKIMTMAIEKGDYDVAITYVHPNVIEMAGGIESMKTILKDRAEIKRHENFVVIQTNTISAGDYVHAGPEIHTIVAQEQVFKLGDSKFKTDVFLLAISSNQGKTWTFANLEAYNQKSIKVFFPHFNDILRLPAPPRAELVD